MKHRTDDNFLENIFVILKINVVEKVEFTIRISSQKELSESKMKPRFRAFQLSRIILSEMKLTGEIRIKKVKERVLLNKNEEL